MAKKNLTAENEVVAETVKVSSEKKSITNQIKDIWDKNSKYILIALAAILVLIVAGFIYNMYKEKKNATAEKAAYANEFAQTGTLFTESNNINADTLKLLLEGGVFDNATLPGYLKIIKNNSGTLAANRAQLFAGRCYLSSGSVKQTANDANAKGEFTKALTHFKAFESNGAYQLEIVKNILSGHAASELENKEDALNYYKKATTINTKDEALTSFALSVAADYCRNIGKEDDATIMYKKITTDYPKSQAAEDAEKLLEATKK